MIFLLCRIVVKQDIPNTEPILYTFYPKSIHYIALSKHEEGWENSRELCKIMQVIVEGLSNLRILQTKRVFKWGYLNMEKRSFAFIKYFSKIRANLRRHNRVCIYLQLNTPID